MGKTKIEWADEVWNPTTGCTPISTGCAHCFAKSIATRFWGERKFNDVQCHPERLDIPLHWRKPRRVFVDSMSDLFHPDIPDNFISAVWMRMISCQQHAFIILTKRPKRMSKLVPQLFFNILENKIYTPSNIWLGVSVENQKTADERLPWLLATPAAVHFLSIEPMLEKIDLSPKDHLVELLSPWYSNDVFDPTASQKIIDRAHWLFPKIDWVIAGCESGQKARPSPSDIDVRCLKDQCVEAGVPFFLKQMWGKKMPELDGRQWLEFPKERVR